jgi:Mn2+/Fe2+ NRAMP family transporter
LYVVITLVLAANIFNLGADIGAMAAAAQLLLPARTWIYIAGFGVTCLLLQVFVPYTKYSGYLKWLTLSLFAYVATAFFVAIDWHAALYASLVPRLTVDKSYLTGMIAVFGTTISPYLFFLASFPGS